jgi:hypothetical protein
MWVHFKYMAMTPTEHLLLKPPSVFQTITAEYTKDKKCYGKRVEILYIYILTLFPSSNSETNL